MWWCLFFVVCAVGQQDCPLQLFWPRVLSGRLLLLLLSLAPSLVQLLCPGPARLSRLPRPSSPRHVSRRLLLLLHRCRRSPHRVFFVGGTRGCSLCPSGSRSLGHLLRRGRTRRGRAPSGRAAARDVEFFGSGTRGGQRQLFVLCVCSSLSQQLLISRVRRFCFVLFCFFFFSFSFLRSCNADGTCDCESGRSSPDCSVWIESLSAGQEMSWECSDTVRPDVVLSLPTVQTRLPLLTITIVNGSGVVIGAR